VWPLLLICRHWHSGMPLVNGHPASFGASSAEPFTTSERKKLNPQNSPPTPFPQIPSDQRPKIETETWGGQTVITFDSPRFRPNPPRRRGAKSFAWYRKVLNAR
jgi:hypothetical protein